MGKEIIVNTVQRGYNQRKAPELHGTRQISPFVFDKLRTDGIFSAWNKFVELQKNTGNPRIPTSVKVVMNSVGSLLLTLGVREMAGVSELGMLVNPYRENIDGRRTIKQIAGGVLFSLAMGLLFTAQDGGGGGGGDFSSDASEHRKAGHAQIDMNLEEGYITPEEAAQKKREYDRRHGW